MRRAVPLLGKLVDFTPHRRSFAGTDPTSAAQAHEHRPTREVLADAVEALQNQERPAPPPTLTEIKTAMKQVEDRIEARLAIFGNGITQHTVHYSGRSCLNYLNETASIHAGATS